MVRPASDRSRLSRRPPASSHNDEQPATSDPRASFRPPAYETPAAPLNDKAKSLVEDLSQQDFYQHGDRRFKNHVQVASNNIADSIADLHERLVEDRERNARVRERRRNQASSSEAAAAGNAANSNSGTQNSSGPSDLPASQSSTHESDVVMTEAEKATTALGDRVEALSAEMEVQIRSLIDAKARADAAERALQELNSNIGSRVHPSGRNALATQSTLGASQFRSSRPSNAEDEEMAENEVNSQGAPPQVGLVELLQEQLAKEEAEWQQHSLLSRYGDDNYYVHFKKSIHHAQNPGDRIPPMPAKATWFRHLQEPRDDEETAGTEPVASNARRRGRPRRADAADPIESDQEADDDDDDIQAVSEKINIKCPLTLRPMDDPVTSRRCPHSFEKAAIDEMLATSSLRGPAGQPSVKCPICGHVLVADDLVPDPVLKRSIRRALAAADGAHRDTLHSDLDPLADDVHHNDNDDNDEEDEDEVQVSNAQTARRRAAATVALIKRERASAAATRSSSRVAANTADTADTMDGDGDGDGSDSE